MKLKFTFILLLSICLFLTSCASSADSIRAKNISSTVYSDFDCKKIKSELRFLTDEVATLSGKQDEIRRKDQMLGWASALLIWPAALFIKGNGQVAEDLANNKGKLETLKRLADDKDCD